MMKKLLWMLKLPEALLAFISGAFVSGSINIFTNLNVVNAGRLITAMLMLVTAICVVCWMITVKPLEEEYKEHYKPGDIKTDVWWYVLNREKNKGKMVVIIIASLLALSAAIVSFMFMGFRWLT